MGMCVCLSVYVYFWISFYLLFRLIWSSSIEWNFEILIFLVFEEHKSINGNFYCLFTNRIEFHLLMNSRYFVNGLTVKCCSNSKFALAIIAIPLSTCVPIFDQRVCCSFWTHVFENPDLFFDLKNSKSFVHMIIMYFVLATSQYIYKMTKYNLVAYLQNMVGV